MILQYSHPHITLLLCVGWEIKRRLSSLDAKVKVVTDRLLPIVKNQIIALQLVEVLHKHYAVVQAFLKHEFFLALLALCFKHLEKIGLTLKLDVPQRVLPRPKKLRFLFVFAQPALNQGIAYLQGSALVLKNLISNVVSVVPAQVNGLFLVFLLHQGRWNIPLQANFDFVELTSCHFTFYYSLISSIYSSLPLN